MNFSDLNGNSKIVQWAKERYIPFLMVLLVFFIPVSSSGKSIVLGFIFAAALSFTEYRNHVIRIFKSPWCWASSLLFLYILLSCLWSPATLSQQTAAINKYSKLLVFPLLAACFMQEKARTWAMYAFLSAIFLTAVLAFLQSWHFINLHGDGFFDPIHVFHSHILTGILMAFASYYCVWMFLNIKTQTRFIYLFLGLLFSYLSLFLSIGRMGYIVYFILMMLLCLQYFSFRKAVLSIFIVAGLFAFVFSQSPTMKENLGHLYSEYQRYQKNEKDTSLGLRIQFHNYAYSLFKENPIAGHGTASFTYLFDKDKPVSFWDHKLLEPHSEYWLTAAEQGFLGLMLLLFFLGSLLLSAFKVNKSRPLLLGLWVAFAVACFSDSLLFYGSPGYFLITMAAISYGELFETKSSSFNQAIL